jgi:DNA-binding response OmpR family regulator
MGEKILYVANDNPYVKIILNQENFLVETAKNKKEALEKLIVGNFCGVVVDIDALDVSAMNFVREMRKNDLQYPTLFLGSCFKEKMKILKNFKMYGFLKKPFRKYDFYKLLGETFG